MATSYFEVSTWQWKSVAASVHVEHLARLNTVDSWKLTMSVYIYTKLASRTEAGGGGIQQKNKKCKKAVALHNLGVYMYHSFCV